MAPTEYGGVWKLLYDWQTLFTGFLAVFAAYIAARPAWKQLASLKTQTAVLARDTLVARVSAMESRRQTTRREVVKITHEFTAQIYPYGGEQEKPEINHPWAFEAEKTANSVIALLTAHQETSLDGELVDAKRQNMIQQAKMLVECLSKIHIPSSADLRGPDLFLTDDQIAEVTEEGVRSEKYLEDRISHVTKSATDLDAAFEAGLEKLRSRIRQIDALVIRERPAWWRRGL
jgi:hypothetical protein